MLWYQQQQQQQQHSHHPEQYYAQQQQMAAAHRLTKKLTSQQQLLWQQQLQADPSMQHADPSMQRVICPHCNKELKNTHSLTVHVSRYHREGGESISEVACPVCKRMYRWVGLRWWSGSIQFNCPEMSSLYRVGHLVG